MRFYAYGIFKGEDHPYRKHFWRKHNPLQAASYLGLKLFLFPLIWFSGLTYLSYNLWQRGITHPALGWIATVHAMAST